MRRDGFKIMTLTVLNRYRMHCYFAIEASIEGQFPVVSLNPI
jgi:hypothetical protein